MLQLFELKLSKDDTMKKLSLSALLLGAALFTGLGAVSLSAKCGSSMQEPVKKCGASMKKEGKKCGASMKKEGKKCGASMKKMKQEKKKSMKCGKGKCGGN